MKETQIQRCPHCNSSNIGIGYQLGGGGLFADRYAYHSGARCSEIETYFCKNCGSVLLQKVKRPEIFEAAGTARGEELLEHIEKNGFLMLQESVYCKLALNGTAVKAIVDNVHKNKPEEGLIQLLTVTEKQYAKMDIVIGETKSEVLDTDERLVIL